MTTVCHPVTQIGRGLTRAYTKTRPSGAKRVSPVGSGVYSQQILPTDPLGSFTLRLKNIIGGTRYRVELLSDQSVAQPSAAAEGVAPGTVLTDVDLTLYYYAAGNARNNLVIKCRRSSASPFYRAFDTQAQAQAGLVIAFIAQQLD